ncbi:hypothetical protein CLV81_3000 [Flagellimonas meridianipacifica]|uniref:Uncharacterized protein n=1 Tax=Flagellimonas meridianipacifica TaxID=1080225 RepID=A0A2T0MAS6_9FLAO|nr:hypothetical protein CLV81_3000 [Allomuricauda pacifica]
MNNIRNKLKNLSNNRLIDVVKNYRQYGYPEEYRILAIDILNNRGVDEMTLKLRGQFDNQIYREAQDSYNSFRRNSRIAFILYLVSIFFLLILPFFLDDLFSTLLILLCCLGYLTFIILSFINQSNFYKSIGKNQMAENPILFLLLGMPLYFLVYFYVKRKMTDQLKIIE